MKLLAIAAVLLGSLTAIAQTNDYQQKCEGTLASVPQIAAGIKSGDVNQPKAEAVQRELGECVISAAGARDGLNILRYYGGKERIQIAMYNHLVDLFDATYKAENEYHDIAATCTNIKDRPVKVVMPMPQRIDCTSTGGNGLTMTSCDVR